MGGEVGFKIVGSGAIPIEGRENGCTGRGGDCEGARTRFGGNGDLVDVRGVNKAEVCVSGLKEFRLGTKLPSEPGGGLGVRIEKRGRGGKLVGDGTSATD
jgi:hypothetical protein